MIKRFTFALAVPIAAGALAFLGWVVIPSFPPPTALVGLTYLELVAKVGAPSGHIPEKFYAWSAGRRIGSWELRVSGFLPDAPPGTPPISLTASRCFFLGTREYSWRLWCSWWEAVLVDGRKQLGAPVLEIATTPK